MSNPKRLRDRARNILFRAAGVQEDYGKLLERNAGASAVHLNAIRAIMGLLPYDFAKDRDTYAQLPDLVEWAETIMSSRPADFLIKPDGPDSDVYMERWYVIPRNEIAGIYLHRILRSDKDVMHDHPWDTTSIILKGSYVEEMPGGSSVRKAGDRIDRRAEQAHRLVLADDQPVISLFFTGPKIRDWGFHCPKGWVGWQEFTGGNHGGRGDTGRGCGEKA